MQLAGSTTRQAESSELSSELLSEKKQRNVVYARAVRILAGREHSTQELTRKLVTKGFPESTVGDVIQALQEQGLQSDLRFVEAFVRSRINKGYGPIRIRRDLYQRGVEDDLIEAELTCSAERWIDLAHSVLNKRFADTYPDARPDARPDSRPKDRDVWNTQARFLARRGFPADLIYRVLGQL
jgi:regulatory protein